MIYDISPLISNKIDVWPNDRNFNRTVSMDTNNGQNITLSSIEGSVHLGSHADAPNHYASGEHGIDRVDLKTYIGHCQVIHINIKRNSRISTNDIKGIIQSERVLFRTLTFPDPTNWNNDFSACSAELIDFLASHNVKLIGIDTPSIDLLNDQALEAHSRVHFHQMAILEGIVLDEVPEGIYELIALPLKIKDADASPVRAILRDI